MNKRRKDTDVQSGQDSITYDVEVTAVNQQLKAANQQLRASEQQLQAANQQLKAHQQQLRAANQQLRANEQQLRAANQQLRASEQQLKAANRRLEESERMLEQTSRLAKTGGWEHDLVSGKATWTKSLFELMKMNVDQAPPGPDEYWRNYHADDVDSVRQAYKRAIEHGEPAELEARRYTADGDLRWWHIYGEPVFEDGKCVRLRGVFQDITEQKLAELALSKSEEQLADAQRIANLGSWEREIDGDEVYCSEQMLRISGVESKAGYVPLEYAESVIHPEDRSRFEEALRRAQKTGRRQSLEYRIKRTDGETVSLSAEIDLLRSEKSSPDRLVGTCRDITESKKARREIETVYQMSLDLMCIADIETATFLRVNPAFHSVLGYDEDELLNRPFLDFVHPDDLEQTIAVMSEKLQKGAKLIAFENRYRTKSGKYIWLEWTSHPVAEEGLAYAIAHNVTRRKEREQRLKASEQKFRSYIDNAPNGIFVADANGNYVDTNPAASDITGYSRDELLNMNLLQMLPPGQRDEGQEHFDRLLAEGYATGELPFVAKSGEVRFWMVSAVQVDGGLYLGFVSDTTEVRKLQQLASRAERLETAGTIAGQVAHDFNNLLGPVMAYPDLIRDELPHDHPVLPYLSDIESAARKMSEINQDLLTMGRRGHYNQEVLDLNQVVLHAVKEVIPRSETLKCHLNLSSDLLNMKGGRAQIHRLLANLLSNALDAMQEIGEITLRTENFYADDTSIAFGRVPKGEYVKLTLSDTGCGIPQDILERIFDPFFTTKTADKKRGSGLGLSVVDAVVKDHNGYLDLQSREGKGTSFYLYFPVTRESRDEGGNQQSLMGNESVLVVDDDHVQREVCRKLLERLGYQVRVVECGEDAVELVRTHQPDLLVLDMVMPGGIDGTETYRQIREIHGHQKAIILSGYSETQRVLEAQKMGAGAFVRKPLTKAVLAHAVRTELDRK